MISRTSLTRLAFVVCLLMSGCVRPVLVKDGLPDNVPKGYAAFTASYYSGKCQYKVTHYNVPVLEVINGKAKYVGRVTTLDIAGDAPNVLRVAAKPGPHTYRVRIGDITRDQVVNIESGRVTRVNIAIECTDMRWQNQLLGGRTIYYYGDFDFKTEESVPLEEWKKREEAIAEDAFR
jgi:hypothetical protein